MSIASIVTLGYVGSDASVNSAVVLGFLTGSGPVPPPAVVVPGGSGDKQRRDREDYFRKRRAKQKKARELARQPQLRMEPVAAPVIEPKVLDFRPSAQIFRALAGPQPLPAPEAKPLEPLPPVPEHRDDEDIYLLTE